MARILIIDDDAPLRGLLVDTLELAGHEVYQAEDGAQGVEVFKIAGADVVVTDMIMPGQEGIETIGQLRKLAPKLPIIAMSGNMQHSSIYLQLANKLGATRTLAKPFTGHQFLAIIDAVLAPPKPEA